MKKLRIPIIAAVLLLCGAAAFGIGRAIKNDNSAVSGIVSYEYPRKISSYFTASAEDNGKLQDIYLGLSPEKLSENTGLSFDTGSIKQGSTSEYMYLVTGDIVSFPFEGETKELISLEGVGSSDAMALFYFSGSSCEYYKYTLASDDSKAIRRLMDSLFKKYDNGSGIKTDNEYRISDVKELGGSVELITGRNSNGQQCFSMSVFDPGLTEDTTKADADAFGEVTVMDYEGIEYNTYSYNSDSSIRAKGVIDNVEISRSISGYIKVKLTGSKTYDASGDNNTVPLRFKLRLIDSSGNVVDAAAVSTPDIRVGEQFRCSTMLNGDGENNYIEYRVEIMEDK